MWAWKLFAIFHKTRYRFRFSFWFVHRWSDHKYSRRWKPIKIERCRQLFGWEIRRKQPSSSICTSSTNKINEMNRKNDEVFLTFSWILALMSQWCDVKKLDAQIIIYFYENEHLFVFYVMENWLEIIQATVDLHDPGNWSESN